MRCLVLCIVEPRYAMYPPPVQLRALGDKRDDNNANRTKPLTYRQRNSMFGLVI